MIRSTTPVRYEYYCPYSRVRGTYYPLLPIRLFPDRKAVKVRAFVDTRALCSVFNADYARSVNLDLTKGTRIPISRFVPKSTPIGYLHKVKVEIAGRRLDIWAVFCDFLDPDPSYDALLARHGVFDQIQIGFREGRMRGPEIYVTPSP